MIRFESGVVCFLNLWNSEIRDYFFQKQQFRGFLDYGLIADIDNSAEEYVSYG
jgi:hypothetical protein